MKCSVQFSDQVKGLSPYSISPAQPYYAILSGKCYGIVGPIPFCFLVQCSLDSVFDVSLNCRSPGLSKTSKPKMLWPIARNRALARRAVLAILRKSLSILILLYLVVVPSSAVVVSHSLITITFCPIELAIPESCEWTKMAIWSKVPPKFYTDRFFLVRRALS